MGRRLERFGVLVFLHMFVSGLVLEVAFRGNLDGPLSRIVLEGLSALLFFPAILVGVGSLNSVCWVAVFYLYIAAIRHIYRWLDCGRTIRAADRGRD
jgi:hypothetical protein